MDFTFEFLQIFFISLGYMTPLLGFLLVVIVLVGRIIGKKEGWTKFDSLYYALITATTVGYGDFRPTKKFSKMLAVVITFTGLIFTGIIVAVALHAATITFKESPRFNQLEHDMEKVIEGADGKERPTPRPNPLP